MLEIKNDTRISIDLLAKRLNVTRRTIICDFEELKERGIIKRIGPAKGGHWEVINDTKNKIIPTNVTPGSKTNYYKICGW
ncbi:MAG: helix-turn-helix domain-containing protein [Bacteroidia bacterium]|nr:helix-turn-helix domain-containing protein [Bacteroidia bacterium]